MTNCKEFFLDDVTAIIAIPVGNIPADTPSSPANRLAPTIPEGGFAPSLVGAVTIGLRPALPGGALIPIRRTTGKAEDGEDDSVAGRLHTVTVNCDIDDRDSGVWDNLFTLERTPSHLLLTFRDGTTQAFVAATRDTYVCKVNRDGTKTSVSFRIQCLMGIQLIV